jgi:H+-transporting ATPase
MTLDIMFVVVLATVFFGFSPLTPVMIVLVALLDDIPIMTIAYDNTRLPKDPVRWHMRRLLFVSGFMGLMAVAQTFGLLLVGMAWLGNAEWQAWIPLTQDQVQTAVFLQIVAGGHLLYFVMRSRSTIFAPPLPSAPIFWAIVGTQVFAVLMVGFGWFVPALPWTVIGLVWLYMLVWMVALDLIKLALYSRLLRATDRPRWYRSFLKGRHAARGAAEAARANA